MSDIGSQHNRAGDHYSDQLPMTYRGHLETPWKSVLTVHSLYPAGDAPASGNDPILSLETERDEMGDSQAETKHGSQVASSLSERTVVMILTTGGIRTVGLWRS